LFLVWRNRAISATGITYIWHAQPGLLAYALRLARDHEIGNCRWTNLQGFLSPASTTGRSRRFKLPRVFPFDRKIAMRFTQVLAPVPQARILCGGNHAGPRLDEDRKCWASLATFRCSNRHTSLLRGQGNGFVWTGGLTGQGDEAPVSREQPADGPAIATGSPPAVRRAHPAASETGCCVCSGAATWDCATAWLCPARCWLLISVALVPRSAVRFWSKVPYSPDDG